MRRFAATLLLALMATPLAAADWPSFHGDSWNTGYIAGSGYQVYVDVWWNNKTLADAQIKASPVLKDGILIVGDLAGLVRALHAESGEELWNHKFAKPIEGTPAIEAERVYVVDSGGQLKALNLRNGRVEHTATLGATLGSITVHEGKLFIGTEAGEIKAYQAETLTLLWTFKVSEVKDYTTGTVCPTAHAVQPIRGAPVVHSGRVFFGSMNHWFYAIDESGLGNGKTTIQWAYKTEDIIIASPTVDSQRSRVYVGSYDGKMYAFPTGGGGLNLCNGDNTTVQPVWTYAVPTFVNTQGGQQISRIHSSAALDGSRLYFGANNGKAYALDAQTGAYQWNRTVGSAIEPVTPSPAVANGIVVQGSEDKRVYWLNAENGTVLRTFVAQSAMKTSAAIDGNRAFIAALDGTLYMFGPKLPPRPDLLVGGMTADLAGVNLTVRNGGDGDAPASQLRLFRSGTFVANLNVSAIPAGQETTLRHAMTFEVGIHDLRALVDPNDDVRESSESNNELAVPVEVRRPQEAPSTETQTIGPDEEEEEEGGGGGGIKIPAAPPLLALLAAVLLLRRRYK